MACAKNAMQEGQDRVESEPNFTAHGIGLKKDLLSAGGCGCMPCAYVRNCCTGRYGDVPNHVHLQEDSK